MSGFQNAREAKEFLISRIVDEAQHEGAPLSEVERKMLYFSETDCTLPGIREISDEFDRMFDQNEYETKIAGLIKRAGKRAQEEGRQEYDAWWAAIHLLSKQDHYVLMMIRRAGLRPARDLLKLWGTSFAAVVLLLCAMFAAIFIQDKYKIDVGRYVPSRDALRLCLWTAVASIAIGYVILRWILGAQKIDGLIGRLLEKLFGISRREE